MTATGPAPPSSARPAGPPGWYRRVLLKLSGEAFGGGGVGVDPDVVARIAEQIAEVVAAGTQVAVVVGGGNFFRGAELSQAGMDRARADYMGMLGTVMNCLALQDFLEKEGVQTRVQTAITMGQVAEPYIPRRAERHLEKGRVVIFGAGVGHAVLLHRHRRRPARPRDRVPGPADGQERCRRRLRRRPARDPAAAKFDDISYDEVLARGLKVADATAISLCMDNGCRSSSSTWPTATSPGPSR